MGWPKGVQNDWPGKSVGAQEFSREIKEISVEGILATWKSRNPGQNSRTQKTYADVVWASMVTQAKITNLPNSSPKILSFHSINLKEDYLWSF